MVAAVFADCCTFGLALQGQLGTTYSNFILIDWCGDEEMPSDHQILWAWCWSLTPADSLLMIGVRKLSASDASMVLSFWWNGPAMVGYL